MKKYVISGSHGFLGTRIMRKLKEQGEIVLSIPRELMFSPKELHAFFEKEQPDIIYHLSAYGNMANQKDIPLICMTNYFGTFNMLHESRDINYRAFIYTSSSSVYGSKSEPMQEDMVLKPDTFYGASKASGELLCRAFVKQFDKPIVSARLFSVYGPQEAEFRFIPTVIRNMIQQTPFSLDEKAYHDWIYIDDVIDALLLLSEHPRLGVVNVGTGRQHTNKEICEMLKRIIGIDYLSTKYEGMRPNDSQVWIADNTLLRKLGWTPKVMLEDGLRKVYEYEKQRFET